MAIQLLVSECIMFVVEITALLEELTTKELPQILQVNARAFHIENSLVNKCSLQVLREIWEVKMKKSFNGVLTIQLFLFDI